MEQAVGQDLGADILQHRAVDQAQQVMPLQHLVQQDAIEEAAERDADQVAGPPEAARRGSKSWKRGGSVRHVDSCEI
jgi:hypothetical protein